MTKSILMSILASQIGGRVIGQDDPEITSALPIQDAVEGSITLADSEKQLARLHASSAVAVLTRKEFEGCELPGIVVDDLHAAFEQCVRLFRTPAQAIVSGVHPTAIVDETANVGGGTTLGPGVSIGGGCSIGENCTIHAGVQIMAGTTVGNNCTLFPNVVLYPDCKIGDRCTLHANATLGAYGFGYRQVEGQHIRTAQLGWVEIEDDVEIGSGTTIDRGTYGATRVGEGTKIDNQVQIGHNCHIGPHNLICAQVGIAGSCSSGSHVVLAGQAGLADHIRLNDGAIIGAQAGVMQDVDAGQVMLGSPAGPRKQKMTEFASMMRLPEMRKELRSLKRQLDELCKASENAEDASRNKAA